MGQRPTLWFIRYVCGYLIIVYINNFLFLVGYDVNTEDTIAILPNKQILLSLNTQTYNRLGIIGEQSILNRTKCCTPKYRIIIDLNKPYFKEDKKHYLRIMECLTRTGLSFNVLLKWEPEQSLIDKEISPNSLELYFNYLKEQNNQPIFSNMSVQKAIPTMKLFQNKNQPIISVEKMLNQNLEKEEFVEWFCLQMAQINFNDEELKDSILHDFEDYISVNSCYDIQCVQTMGFFTSFNIKKLIQVLEPENLSQNLNMIMIHGFEDSPQCWSGKNNEHYKNLSGENIYGFSFLNTEKTLIWCLADEYDFGIEKF